MLRNAAHQGMLTLVTHLHGTDNGPCQKHAVVGLGAHNAGKQLVEVEYRINERHMVGYHNGSSLLVHRPPNAPNPVKPATTRKIQLKHRKLNPHQKSPPPEKKAHTRKCAH